MPTRKPRRVLMMRRIQSPQLALVSVLAKRRVTIEKERVTIPVPMKGQKRLPIVRPPEAVVVKGLEKAPELEAIEDCAVAVVRHRNIPDERDGAALKVLPR
jgi:hypothetical protein